MKNLLMKRLVVTVLLASWCIQPVLAVDVSTWAQLKDAVQNDGTYTFTSNLTSDGAITVAAGKLINLDGQKLYYADGQGSKELFINYGNLTVDNVTLQNGAAPIDATAGAIRNYSDLTIGSNAVLSGNKSYQGGAVHQEQGSTTVLSGAKFVNNTANKNSSNTGGYGGAINVQAGTLHFNGDASFISNTSATNGGAIYNAGALTIADGGVLTFDSNTAANGGALYNTGDLTLKGNFKNNQASTQGGAIYNTGKLTIKSGSIFDGNIITTNYNDGGAIYSKGQSLIIEDGVTFENNKASFGGALFVGGPKDTAGQININGAKFINNIATVTDDTYATGGAIYLATPGSGAKAAELTLKNSTFEKNSATASNNDAAGGALGLFAKSSIDNVIFKENSVVGNDGGGVAFLGAVSETEFKNSTFTGNTSSTRGGAIAARAADNANNSKAILDILDSTFEKNVAGTKGGALHNYFYNSKNSSGAVYIGGSDFKSNSAQDGGAIYNELYANQNDTVNKANIKIDGSKFTNNSATASGGAIYNMGEMTIGGLSQFSGNTASTNGGAVYNSGSLALDTSAGDITFTNNKAAGVANDIALVGTSSTDKAVLNITGASNSVILDAITGDTNSVINKNAANKLVLNGDNSNFTGDLNFSSGSIDVASAGTFFGGTNNISGSAVLNVDGILAGTNEITGGTINLNNGASTKDGTINNIKGGTVNVKNGATLAGINNISSGTLDVLGTLNATNNITNGNVILNNISTLLGNTTLSGGTVTIKGGAVSDGATITFNPGGALTLDTSTGALNLGAVTSSSSGVGLITHTGNGQVNISNDQSGFKGSYASSGTTNVVGTVTDKATFFGGNSTISSGGKLNLGSNSEIAASSNVTMSSGSSISATDGAAINGNLALNGNSSLSTSGNVSISGTTTSDGATSSILNTGHLTLSGNQEGYIGSYEQRGSSAITELLNNSTFFGGKSDIYAGQFIFHQTASLSSKDTASVNIKNEDVTLSILGAHEVKDNVISVNGGVFNLEAVTLTDTIIDGDSSFNDSSVTFGKDAGFADNSNISLNNGATLTLGNDSVAGDGDIKVDSASNLNLNSSNLNYNMSTTGDGNVTVGSDTANVTLTSSSDNSAFTGKFQQTGGTVNVKDGAKFFGNENTFVNNSVINFESGSVLLGSNTIKDNANVTINAGTSFGTSDMDIPSFVLQGGSVDLKSANATDTLDLTLGFNTSGETGVINKTGDGLLVVTADQTTFDGIFNHNSGSTVVNNKFFSGTNQINGGSITFDTDGILQGNNIINGGSLELKSNDNVGNTEISFGAASTGKLIVNTETSDDKMDLNFKVAGDSGTIYKVGEGTLNLIGDKSDFKGNVQIGGAIPTARRIALFNNSVPSGGVVEVNDKFFGGTTNLLDGTINFHEGSEIVTGSNLIFSGAGVVNIDGDTTINGVISSTVNEGNINLTDGTLTINGDQSGYTGKFTQAVDKAETVIGSTGTFFGGDPANDATKNEITAGKVTVEQGGKLATDVFVNRDVIITIKNDTGKTYIDSNGLFVSDDSAGHFVGEFNIAGLDLVTKGTGVITQNVIISNDGRLTLENETLDTIHIGDGSSSNVITLSDGANTSYDKAMKYQVNNNATLQLAPTKDGTLSLATDVTGTGNVLVDEIVTLKGEGKGTGTVAVNSDNSGFNGNYTQKSGNVILSDGSKFFGGTNVVEGGALTISKGGVLGGQTNSVSGGSVNLQDGAILETGITAQKNSSSGAGTYGTINIYNAIVGTVQDPQRPDTIIITSNDIANGNEGLLTYLNSDGTNKDLNFNSGAGLGLFNGTRINGDLNLVETTGVRDLTLGNGSGVEADNIILGDNTKLTYKDNAYIQDDSTVQIGSGSSLNFANDKTSIKYNPSISSTDDTSSINKTAAGSTAIASALDNYHGSVNVSGGLLDLITGEDKTLSAINVSNGAALHIASNANITNAAGNDGKVNLTNGQLQVDGNLSVKDELSAKNNSTLFVKENLTSGNANIENSVLTVLKGFSAADLAITGDSSTANLYGNTSANNLTLADKAVLNNYGNVSVNDTFTIGAAGASATSNPTINMMSGSLNSIIANNININSNSNIMFDADPRTQATDTILANNIINNSGSPDPYTILVSGINFTRSPIDRNVTFDISNILQDSSGSQASMVRLPDGGVIANSAMGQYLITSSGAGNPILNASLLALNPQMYRGQVATIASWQNQLVVNNMLFNHMDILYRQLVDEEKTANKYAAAYPQFAPYQYDLKGGSLWYKAYGNFERLSMTRGLSVGNNAYGSLIGADFPLIKLKNGWKLVPTAYVGYNGAHQTFNGVGMYQNGAQIGFMGTAFKGDFITSLLAYGGGYANDMSVRGGFGNGSDTTGNWFAGVASKSAYNIRLPHDFVFQPTAMVAYNVFGSQNWGSGFGAMSMNSGMLNGLNAAPGFNLIWQKKTFSLYVTAQMVYNIMGQSDGRAGNVDLGNIRMRHSYFEYGFGAMKQFKDRFTGYLQITFRNGGRTGVGFQGGLQWKVGKE